MSISFTDMLQDLALSTPTAEIDKISDQIQLLADLYIFLIEETPKEVRKDFIDCITHFARETLDTIQMVC